MALLPLPLPLLLLLLLPAVNCDWRQQAATTSKFVVCTTEPSWRWAVTEGGSAGGGGGGGNRGEGVGGLTKPTAHWLLVVILFIVHDLLSLSLSLSLFVYLCLHCLFSCFPLVPVSITDLFLSLSLIVFFSISHCLCLSLSPSLSLALSRTLSSSFCVCLFLL